MILIHEFIYIFLGIINSRHIAGVVSEGRFAGHLIDNDTELVFMDEWTSDSLSCEDAKRILQGILKFLNISVIFQCSPVHFLFFCFVLNLRWSS